METSLLTYLAEVPDFRRGQGKRYSLPHVLAMIIMGKMSGCHGYRELGSFVKANAAELQEHLGTKTATMPSHVTIRTILREIDFNAVCNAFERWVSATQNIAPGDLVCIDGKALASTVEDTHSRSQNFTALVSAFAQRQGIVLAVARFANGKSSEIPTVQELITTLDLKAAVLSLDALHCQKKQ
jgi:hypothetical protein